VKEGEMDEERNDIVIPVVEEEVVAGARPVKSGGVRVDKHVDQRIRRVQVPLLHEEVEVRRVPVNKVVKEAPSVRRQGEVVIVPVVEEELIITKRLVLKEEIHLITRRTKDRFVKDVTVDRERAVVHRLDAEGRVVDTRPGHKKLFRETPGSRQSGSGS
jgi:uncharacterized protein (TIGR02271 family)